MNHLPLPNIITGGVVFFLLLVIVLATFVALFRSRS